MALTFKLYFSCVNSNFFLVTFQFIFYKPYSSKISQYPPRAGPTLLIYPFSFKYDMFLAMLVELIPTILINCAWVTCGFSRIASKMSCLFSLKSSPLFSPLLSPLFSPLFSLELFKVIEIPPLVSCIFGSGKLKQKVMEFSKQGMLL